VLLLVFGAVVADGVPLLLALSAIFSFITSETPPSRKTCDLSGLATPPTDSGLD
jgi:hypothetical protein